MKVIHKKTLEPLNVHPIGNGKVLCEENDMEYDINELDFPDAPAPFVIDATKEMWEERRMRIVCSLIEAKYNPYDCVSIANNLIDELKKQSK